MDWIGCSSLVLSCPPATSLFAAFDWLSLMNMRPVPALSTPVFGWSCSNDPSIPRQTCMVMMSVHVDPALRFLLFCSNHCILGEWAWDYMGHHDFYSVPNRHDAWAEALEELLIRFPRKKKSSFCCF